MHYLEDFIESTENLPEIIRDRLTELREADLTVQNNVDHIEHRKNKFFRKARNMKPHERDAEHQAIMKQYKETMAIADEKVTRVDDVQNIIKMYIKKLDQELAACQADLEDENKGITNEIEKRSLESDQKLRNNHQKENRDSLTSRDKKNRSRRARRRQSSASSTSIEKQSSTDNVSSASTNLQDSRASTSNSGNLISQSASADVVTQSTQSSTTAPNVSSISYSLGHIGIGGDAIAAAASQAIAATQQMQLGRRTASLKASYEAINTSGVHAGEFSREIAGAAQTAIAAIKESSKKNRRKVGSAISATSNINLKAAQQSMQQQQQQQQVIHTAAQVPLASSTIQTGFNATADAAPFVPIDEIVAVSGTDCPVDPNEPRYCLCNQVSYGDMIACDNSDCPYEWFHYPCVNITAPPEGRWYCPPCTSSMKRRN